MKVLNKRTEENKVNEGRLLENKKVVHTELERILSYYSLIILTVITKTIIHYGKVCLRHHDLLNYRKGLFKTDIFRKIMIRHSWQFPLFSLTSSQKSIL